MKRVITLKQPATSASSSEDENEPPIPPHRAPRRFRIVNSTTSSSRFNPYLTVHRKTKCAPIETGWIPETVTTSDDRASASMLELVDDAILEMGQPPIPDRQIARNDFPPLTEAQRQIYVEAMSASSGTLIQKFKIDIYRDDMQRLRPSFLLNDNIINFYMNLLMERSKLRENHGYPKVYAFDTHFVERLQAGYSNVRRWTKKVDIFSYAIIAIPVHIPNPNPDDEHWCMAICNMNAKTIKYYDSLRKPNDDLLILLSNYLDAEHLDKKKSTFDRTGWTVENVENHPYQNNGCDCGVFSCMTAEFICRNRPIIFTQRHMPYFRRKMTVEIYTGNMLT